MTKIFMGEQVGDSTSDVALDTDGASNLEIHGGKLRERAKGSVRILDRNNPTVNATVPAGVDLKATSTTRSASNAPTMTGQVQMGVFLLIAFPVIAGVFVATAKYVHEWWKVPVVLVATLLGLYFLASAILPRQNVANLSGFASSLKDFMGHILRKPSGDK